MRVLISTQPAKKVTIDIFFFGDQIVEKVNVLLPYVLVYKVVPNVFSNEKQLKLRIFVYLFVLLYLSI